MCAVRDDDLLARIALRRVIGPEEERAHQLALRAGRGLQGDRVHPGDLLEHLAQLPHQPEGALHRRSRLKGVKVAKPRQARRQLVHLGIVLHRARAQRVERFVHVVVLQRDCREMPDYVVLGNLRQSRRRFPQRPRRKQLIERSGGKIGLGDRRAAPPRARALEDQRCRSL